MAEEAEISKLSQEAELLEKLDHKNIVRLYKVHESRYHYFIVMERLKGGTLWDLVSYRKRMKSSLTEKECKVIMKQVFEGIAYLHAANLLHRDLKPANILLKSADALENSVKLADFGLSTRIESGGYYNPTGKCGTKSYMAPEIIQGKSYSFVCIAGLLI